MLQPLCARAAQALLLAGLACGGLLGCGSDEPAKDAGVPHAMSAEWPTIELVAEVGAAGGVLEDPSGVRVSVPPATFADGTKVSVKTTEEPALVRDDVVVRGPILKLQTDPPHAQFFAKPVEVTLPFEGEPEQGLTAAYWSGSSWRRFGGRVDPDARTVRFDTLDFSTYSIIVDAWDDYPEIVITDPHDRDAPVREVPRGSIVQLVLKLEGKPPSGMTLEGRLDPATPVGSPDSQVVIAPDPSVPAGFMRTGQARLKSYSETTTWSRLLGKKEGMWARFLVRVPHDAPLGRHDLELTSPTSAFGSLGWPRTVRGAIEVTNRKTFLLIIDGLHSRIFENALRDPHGSPPNLGLIFGSPKPNGPPPTKLDLKPSKAGPGAEVVKAIRLDSGYIFPRATTIFPSYTFAGNAAIVTGRSVGAFGIPGNEFFDRAPRKGQRQGRYSFTSAYATLDGLLNWQTGFMDPIRSYWDEALANSVLRCDTLYQDITEGDLADLSLKNVVSVHMYFGPPKPEITQRLSVDTFTQAFEFQLSSHGVDFDKDMLAKVLSALGRSPRMLSREYFQVTGLTTEEPQPHQKSLKHYLTAWGRYSLSMARRLAAEKSRRQNARRGDAERSRAAARKTGVITLYFASLDHAGHAHYQHGDVKSVHRAMLYKHIDPMIGVLLKSLDEVTLRNSLFVVVSDHGQSDMGAAIGAKKDDDASGVDVPHLYEYLNRHYQVENWSKLPLPPRKVDASDCVVAYNSGLAHVYVRHSRDPNRQRASWSPWHESLASPFEVLRLARTELLDEAQRSWKGKLDLILLRLPKGFDLSKTPTNTPMKDVTQTEYFALDPRYPDAPVVPLATYLDAADPKQCVLYEDRYGWSRAEDKPFLLEIIQSMNCDRSGDVVVLPRYPAYYFEYSDYLGNHGGLVRDDMECALGIATPGLDMETDDRLERLALESIDLVSKPRVGNRDVRSLIANYYRQKAHVERAPVAVGGLTVRSVRPPGFYTAVEITSPDLANLGPDEGMMFALYRTDDPDKVVPGSTLAREHAVTIYADTPVLDPDGYDFLSEQQGRIAKDKVQILDKLDELSDEPPAHFNPGPYYYQVGMTRVQRDGTELAREVRSNIAGPGKPIIDVLHPPKGPEEDLADFVETKSGWALIAANLTFSGNHWACDGAEFIAETQGWRGHFYSGHSVGGTRYGDDTFVGTGMMARIWIPHPAPGGYVKITARGKGFSAERTLRLPPGEPPAINALPRSAHDAKLKELRRRVANMEEAVGEFRARGEAAPSHQMELLAKYRFDLAHFEQIVVAGRSLKDKLAEAQRSLDFKRTVAVLQARQALAAKGLDLTLAHYAEMRRIYAAWAKEYEEAPRQVQSKLTDMEGKLSRAGEFRARQQLHHGRLVAEAALAGGDAQTFQEAMTATIAAAQLLREYEGVARNLRRHAEGLVMLTGDRVKACRLWQDADRVELEGAADDEQKKAIQERQQERPGPAWWPADN